MDIFSPADCNSIYLMQSPVLRSYLYICICHFMLFSHGLSYLCFVSCLIFVESVFVFLAASNSIPIKVKCYFLMRLLCDQARMGAQLSKGQFSGLEQQFESFNMCQKGQAKVKMNRFFKPILLLILKLKTSRCCQNDPKFSFQVSCEKLWGSSSNMVLSSRILLLLTAQES